MTNLSWYNPAQQRLWSCCIHFCLSFLAYERVPSSAQGCWQIVCIERTYTTWHVPMHIEALRTASCVAKFQVSFSGTVAVAMNRISRLSIAVVEGIVAVVDKSMQHKLEYADIPGSSNTGLFSVFKMTWNIPLNDSELSRRAYISRNNIFLSWLPCCDRRNHFHQRPRPEIERSSP